MDALTQLTTLLTDPCPVNWLAAARILDKLHKEADFARIQPLCSTQKDFALLAVKTRCSSALFMLRAGKVKSIGEFLRTRVKAEDLLRLVGLRDKTVGATDA